MPTSNAEQNMATYNAFVSIADDVSAIPKYVGGQAGAGGAGRTASGLAMLMGNASKILQTVASNIDRDVLEPALTQLADLILLTDTTGLLTGEEKISVQGVDVAVQKETIRQRQIEFLQAVNNPTDHQIVGLAGRANILRAVATTIGLDGDSIVPSEQEMEQMEKQQKQQQAGGGNMPQQVQQGVQKGVEQGIQKITSELVAGQLAPDEGMTEGPPAHVGTPAGSAGEPLLQGGGADAAARSQGQQKPQVPGGMAPNSATVTGNQPAPVGPGGPPRISPGVG
jgi:hypothetical protein